MGPEAVMAVGRTVETDAPTGRDATADATHAVKVSGLTVVYGRTHKALASFDFAAEKQKVTAVIGPNGSGKTSFLNAFTGAVPFKEGSISLFGTEVAKVTPRSMYKLGVSRTFQNLLIDDLSVEDNVRVGASSKVHASVIESMPTAPRARRESRTRRDAAGAAIERMGLTALRKFKTSELSYGYRRRVEIARALASSPRVLLLDEPTAGMGPYESAEFADLMLVLAALLDLCVVVVEHDMSVVRTAASAVYVLRTGNVVDHGTPDRVLSNTEVKRIYLGDFAVRDA